MKKVRHAAAIIRNAKKNDPVTQRMLKDNRVSVILENFHGVVWQEKVKTFPCFTIYDSPKDFPGKFVVRLFDGNKPTRLIAVKDTLEAAREAIQTDFYFPVKRDEADDPVIVETWL